jgi:peptidoglycan/LPS O-acetylase OafA/YrhL
MPVKAKPPEQLVYELTAIALAIAVAVIPTYLVERPLLRWQPRRPESPPAPVPAAATGRN